MEDGRLRARASICHLQLAIAHRLGLSRNNRIMMRTGCRWLFHSANKITADEPGRLQKKLGKTKDEVRQLIERF